MHRLSREQKMDILHGSSLGRNLQRTLERVKALEVELKRKDELIIVLEKKLQASVTLIPVTNEKHDDEFKKNLAHAKSISETAASLQTATEERDKKLSELKTLNEDLSKIQEEKNAFDTFFSAIKGGKLSEVVSLLPLVYKKKILNICDENGNTPLLLAINHANEKDGFEILETLLKEGADPNQVYRMGSMVFTPLRHAIMINPKLVDLLVKYEADINHIAEDGLSPLSFALCNLLEKDKDTIATLLKHNPNSMQDQTLNNLIMPQLKAKKKLFYQMVEEHHARRPAKFPSI